MNNKSMFLEKDGLKLHYKITGQGKPLILLNSAFADLRIWDLIVEGLSKKYKIIQLDFRYTGKTEQSDSDYSMYEDLNYLIDELELSDVSLIGLSAGAHTALEYTIQYPEKVCKLFLISAGLFGLEEDINKVKKMNDFQSELFRGNIEEATKIWTKTWLVGEKRSEKDISSHNIELFKSITRKSLLKSVNFKMPCFINPSVNEFLDKIDKEVYNLVGTYDYEDVFNSAKALSKKIKNYKEEKIESGHIIALEQANLLIDRIIKFID